MVTKKITFAVAPLEASQLAPDPGIVFYMLWAMYLGNIIDPEAPADTFGHLTRSGHSTVTNRRDIARFWSRGFPDGASR